jgi:hypothetical protein
MWLVEESSNHDVDLLVRLKIVLNIAILIRLL